MGCLSVNKRQMFNVLNVLSFRKQNLNLYYIVGFSFVNDKWTDAALAEAGSVKRVWESMTHANQKWILFFETAAGKKAYVLHDLFVKILECYSEILCILLRWTAAICSVRNSFCCAKKVIGQSLLMLSMHIAATLQRWGNFVVMCSYQHICMCDWLQIWQNLWKSNHNDVLLCGFKDKHLHKTT